MYAGHSLVISTSVAETWSLRDSQQASASLWAFPVLRSLGRNTCFYSAAWKVELLPRKYRTLSFTLDLGNAEASFTSQSVGSSGLMDNLQWGWSWKTAGKTTKFMEPRKEKLMGMEKCLLPILFIFYDLISFKCIVCRQNSDQELEWGQLWRRL